MIFWLGVSFWAGSVAGAVATLWLLGLSERQDTDERQAVREAEKIIHVERVK